MAESSGPISQGTTAERQFTDVQWRDRFGDEPGVLSDMDGSAYAVSLVGGGDVVNIGSSTQASLATVAGFVHRISQSSPTPITIPVASGSVRTDIIALRYDPAFTGAPGPVRLTRIVGSSASVPAYDSSPPGVEDLPLWSITRQPGQALNLATVQRMFPRIAPALGLATTSTLPTSAPLDTLVTQGQTIYRRELVSGSPAWRIFKGSNLQTTAFPNSTVAGTGNITTSTLTASLGGAPYRLKVTASVVTTMNGSGGPSFDLFIDGVVRDQFPWRDVTASNLLYAGKVSRTIDVADGHSISVSARISIPFGVTATSYNDDRHSWLTVEVEAL